MSVEQALELLDKLTSQLNLPRSGHAQVQLALKVLSEALKKDPI